MATYLHDELGHAVDVTKQTAGTTTDGSGREYALGSRATGSDGSKFIYVQAGAAVAQYQAVAIDELGQAALLTSALALDGHRIGFAQAAFDDNDMGWVLLDSGQGNTYKVGVLSACDSDVKLMTSGTAGYLDDAYTTFIPLGGVVITTTLATTGGATAIVREPVRPSFGIAMSGV